MVRISKQQKRRLVSPRRPRVAGVKTGPKKDTLKTGYKEHANAIEGENAKRIFIGKI
jgi:hypothetical protein